MSTRVRTTVVALSTLLVALLLMGAVLARSTSDQGAYHQLGVYADVLQRIKSDPRTRIIPVVVLTSSKEHSDVQGSYDLGANSYIVKPVNFEGFVAAMQQLSIYWLLVNQPPNPKA